MTHQVMITITASTDEKTCDVLAVVDPPCPTMTPDAQKLFAALVDTAARLVLGEMVRNATVEEQPA